MAGVQRRREADVDVRLGHADDPRDPPQRLVAPEELGQRRARVVEEVDRVDVEDVDRAAAVVRDAVLVLAPQAERRADLAAGGVAATLTARDHDDPALGVVPLVPHAARADDARVVIRMGPLAHHVDLHGLAGRVRRRGSRRDHPQRDRRGQQHRRTSRPPHTRTPSNDIEQRLRPTLFRRLSSCAATLGCRALDSPEFCFLAALALPASAHAAPVLNVDLARESGALRPSAPGRRDAHRRHRGAGRPGGRARGPALPVRGLLPRHRAHHHRRRRASSGSSTELDRNHRLRVVAPAQKRAVGAAAGLHAAGLRALLPRLCARRGAALPALHGAQAGAPERAHALLSRPPRRQARASIRRTGDAQARARRALHVARSTVTLPVELERRVPLRLLLPRLARLRDGRPGPELPEVEAASSELRLASFEADRSRSYAFYVRQ